MLFRPAPRFEGLPADAFEAFAIHDRERRRRAILAGFHPALKLLGDDLLEILGPLTPSPLHAHLPRLDWPAGYQPFCTWLAISHEAHGYQAAAQLNVGVHPDHVAVRLAWDTGGRRLRPLRVPLPARRAGDRARGGGARDTGWRSGSTRPPLARGLPPRVRVGHRLGRVVRRGPPARGLVGDRRSPRSPDRRRQRGRRAARRRGRPRLHGPPPAPRPDRGDRPEAKRGTEAKRVEVEWGSAVGIRIPRR